MRYDPDPDPDDSPDDWTLDEVIALFLEAKGTPAATEYLDFVLPTNLGDDDSDVDTAFQRLIALHPASLNVDELCYALHYLMTEHSLDSRRAERMSPRFRELLDALPEIPPPRNAIRRVDDQHQGGIPAHDEHLIAAELDTIASAIMADWFSELGFGDLSDELRRNPAAFEQRLHRGECSLVGKTSGDQLSSAGVPAPYHVPRLVICHRLP
jgi:hypothetical protein